MDNKILDFEVDLPNVRFCGSSKGWLVAIDVNYVVTLINPFYRVKGRVREDSIIYLPPLTPPNMDEIRKRIVERSSNCDYFVYKVTLSSDPVLDAENCIVVVIFKRRVGFIRISKDIAWTYTEERFIHPLREVICVQGKCYFVNTKGKLLCFHITPEDYSDINLVADEIPLTLVEDMLRPRYQRMLQNTYLVHANEKDLVVVQRFMSVDDDCHNRRTEKVLVFRFDLVECKFTKINSLGDVSLFIGDNSSETVLASSKFGCLPNCIYFTPDLDYLRRYEGVPHCDFGVYSLKGRSFLPFDNTHVANLVKNTGRGRPVWLIPTFKL